MSTSRAESEPLVSKVVRQLGAQLAENLNAAVFAVGFATAYVGLSQWSSAAANVAAGVVLMVIGAWPFLRQRKS